MKLILAFVLIAANSVLAQTVETTAGAKNQKIHARFSTIHTLVREQKQDLIDAKSRLSWTWGELQTAQGQVAQVGAERDWYREHYEQDEVELAKYRKHGIFGGILSVVGLVFSFVSNPFAFIVSRALQVVFGIGLALIIFAVALFIIRRIKKHHETHP